MKNFGMPWKQHFFLVLSANASSWWKPAAHFVLVITKMLRMCLFSVFNTGRLFYRHFANASILCRNKIIYKLTVIKAETFKIVVSRHFSSVTEFIYLFIVKTLGHLWTYDRELWSFLRVYLHLCVCTYRHTYICMSININLST